ncbi:MAG: ATP-binding cassette domain-containing protein, partial [Saprospiraceae bacterium]
FMFPRPQQQVYVSQLSGGEKRRLYLLTVLMKNPNFLILDEPTNDLDIMTLNILEDFLLEFPGCILIVSHDRFFLDKLADHLFIFEGDGKIRDFNGNYSDYRQELKENPPVSAASASANQSKEPKSTPSVTAEPPISQEQRKAINRVESQIKKLEARKVEINQQFTKMDGLTSDRIAELGKELSAVNDEIEEREMEWMELVG